MQRQELWPGNQGEVMQELVDRMSEALGTRTMGVPGRAPHVHVEGMWVCWQEGPEGSVAALTPVLPFLCCLR